MILPGAKSQYRLKPGDEYESQVSVVLLPNIVMSCSIVRPRMSNTVTVCTIEENLLRHSILCYFGHFNSGHLKMIVY